MLLFCKCQLVIGMAAAHMFIGPCPMYITMADLASLVASSTTITSWQTGSRIQVQKELRRALDCPYSKPLAALNHCRC